MSMVKRYTCGFYSLGGVRYDIDILQEGFSGSVSDVALCDDPLEIEWSETSKMDVLQPSSATLQLYSDNDRQFIDLYSVAPCNVRMDVYRSGVLYWSGTLDPELYTEPYAYKTDYGVSLTFSDMAVLDRSNFDMSGFVTLQALILSAVEKTCVNYSGLQQYISTYLSGKDSNTFLSDITLLSDNMFDEDGKAMTWHDALENSLKTFGLRIIQKAGHFVVYDINAVYTAFKDSTNAVNWALDDSNIDVDKIYNNVKLTFSPYHHTTVMKASVDTDSVTGGSSILVKLDNDTDTTVEGFRIMTSDTGEGLTLNAGKFFKVTPEYSGSEEAGVAWTIKQRDSGGNYTAAIGTKDPAHTTAGALFTVPSLGYVGYTGNNANYRLRLTLQMLADVRYNPFESESLANEEGNYDEMQNRCNNVYIPIKLTLKDASGNALYHYVNSNIYNPTTHTSSINPATGWVSGAASWGDAYLAWYDNEDRKSKCGIGGWQPNKQCIGYYRKKLPLVWTKSDPGEYISLPPVGGWLELQVGDGFYSYDYKFAYSDIYDEINWLLYKDPKIELVKKNFRDVDTEDVEHNAWLLKTAKEELSFDTYIGSMDAPSPTALGQIFSADHTNVVTKMYRNGVYDIPERLLIGTIFSAYASRHYILSGTSDLLASFACYKDNNTSGLFMLLSETQNLHEDESDIEMVEIGQDNYQAES